MAKKLFVIMFLSIIVLNLSSCVFIPLFDNSDEENVFTVKTQMKNDCKEIIRCLEEKDSDTLKNMFCEKLLNNYENIDEDIEQAMVFFQGNITSYGNVLYGDSDSIRNGEYVLFTVSPHIKELKTDADKEYRIKYYQDLINVENPDRIGVSYIKITDETDNICEIGDFYLVNPEYK